MITPARPQLDQAFLSALLREDELGVVVRAHIHVEASLNEFIDAIIPFPERLPNLRYRQRVDLACALGLKEEHAPALVVLGEMRNAFAHKLDSSISTDSIAKLYNALAPTDRRAAELAYRGTKSQLLIERGPEFRKLEPQEQFVLIAACLKAMLVIATHEERNRRRNP